MRRVIALRGMAVSGMSQRQIADALGISQPAVSQQLRCAPDLDLLVDAPPATSSFGFIGFKQLIEQVLGREIDLFSCGGLKPTLDDDIRGDAVLL